MKVFRLESMGEKETAARKERAAFAYAMRKKTSEIFLNFSEIGNKKEPKNCRESCTTFM